MIELKDYGIDERHLHPYFGHPDPNELEPFDKVLVREGDSYCWKIQLFSHMNLINDKNPYICMDNCAYAQCVKYTNETCHLLNTKESLNPPESEYKFGDKIEFYENGKWVRGVFFNYLRGKMKYWLKGERYNILREIGGIWVADKIRKADW